MHMGITFSLFHYQIDNHFASAQTIRNYTEALYLHILSYSQCKKNHGIMEHFSADSKQGRWMGNKEFILSSQNQI